MRDFDSMSSDGGVGEETPAPALFEDAFTIAAILATVRSTGLVTSA